MGLVDIKTTMGPRGQEKISTYEGRVSINEAILPAVIRQGYPACETD